MGFVFPLPIPPASYPATIEFLEPAESLVLRGLRLWLVCRRQGEDPRPVLETLFGGAMVGDAARSVEGWMAVVARTALRPLSVNCPRCPKLSTDEAWCLHAAAAAQRGEEGEMRAALRQCLSAVGAEFAAGPVEGLAEILGEAGLLFRRRMPPPILPEEPPASGLAWH